MDISFHLEFHENKVLKLLYLVNGIFVFIASLLGPLYAMYVGGIKSGALAISFSWTVLILSSTLFLVFISSFGDKIKNKAAMVFISFLIRSLGWFLLAFISTFFQLLLIQVLLALGDAVGGPAFDALLAEHLDKKEHIHDYSDWRILAYLATAAGTMAGGYIISISSFKVLFISMSLLTIIPAIVLYFGMVIKKKH